MLKFFYTILNLIFTLAILHSSVTWAESEARYAIIITIDGLRPDAISQAKTPFLDSLLEEGSYSLEAKTVNPPRTLPAHTSLITGLIPQRHRTMFNFWNKTMGHINTNTIFSIAKKHDKKTAFFAGKDKLGYLATPGTLDHFESTGKAESSVEDITNAFMSYFKKQKPELTLLHFPEPDLSGHRHGWMSEQYFSAMEKIDRAIETIIDFIGEEGVYEETLLIITSDHGGKGKTHNGTSEEVIKIPWIAVGNDVRKNYKIENNVFIYDTAPTLLLALGLETPQDWDGKPIKEIFLNLAMPDVKN